MFERNLRTSALQVAGFLDARIAEMGDHALTSAMRHAISGGKGLRGFLVLESARLHDVEAQHALCAAAAVEAIHAFSLVHDDLPCMDDDDLRRGKPTVHVKWDEATAVLAGDALQALGMELVSDCACHPDPAVRADLVLALARASGARGMVLGQARDIAAESACAPFSLDQITALQQEKTGALIVWSAEAGARLSRSDTGPLHRYANALGLAFQIADDVLDVVGDVSEAGKRLQKDAAARKATFVAHLGLEGARRKARALVEQACDSLSVYGARADVLRDAAYFAIARTR